MLDRNKFDDDFKKFDRNFKRGSKAIIIWFLFCVAFALILVAAVVAGLLDAFNVVETTDLF